MANTPAPLTLVLQANVGYLDNTTQCLIDYVEPTTSTTAYVYEQSVPLAGTASYQPVDLYTLFPSLTSTDLVIVYETTNPPTGFQLALSNTDPNLLITNTANLSGGFFAFRSNGTTPPTLYLSNPNTTAVNVQIVATGS